MIDIEELKNRVGVKTFIYLKGAMLLLAAVLLAAISYGMTNKTERLLRSRKAELKSFYERKYEYMKERAIVAPLEKRLLLPQSRGSAAAVIEEIGGLSGIKSSINSFRPFEDKAEKGYLKNGVEVKVEGINLNQMANFLYRVENYRNLLLIRDFSMKSRFDNPDVYDMTMQVVLVAKHE